MCECGRDLVSARHDATEEVECWDLDSASTDMVGCSYILVDST